METQSCSVMYFTMSNIDDNVQGAIDVYEHLRRIARFADKICRDVANDI
jgi:hypothetical protein